MVGCVFFFKIVIFVFAILVRQKGRDGKIRLRLGDRPIRDVVESSGGGCADDKDCHLHIRADKVPTTSS